jgi:Holliday junction DNA helicase RuvA
VIAFLKGRLLSKDPTNVVVETGGVGYQVLIPLSTFYELGEEGSEVRLHVYTHLRDETIELYGFITTAERMLFRKLITISGIGPKLALSLLSGMQPADLLAAVESGEYQRIMQVPGVGKKTAERLVLELRDKLPDLRAGMEVSSLPEPGTPAAAKRDLISALVNLGYKRRDAERAAEKAVGQAGPESEFSDLLKRCLAQVTGLE